MTDTETSATKKKLSLSRPGKLELKKTVEGGQVRQNFSHGRSKVVTVEVRKKRTFTQSSGGSMTELKKTLEPIVEEEPQETSEQQIEETPAPTLESGPTLTDQERAARAKALEEAKRVEEKRALKEKEDKADEVLRSEKAESDTLVKVEEDEIAELSSQLSSILDWVEQLKGVDTNNVEPLNNVSMAKLPLRKDEESKEDKLNDVLLNIYINILTSFFFLLYSYYFL